MCKQLRDFAPVLRLFWRERPRMLLGGAVLAAVTVLAGMALLGLSGWFISATAIAGLSVGTALVFDVFMPSAGIRMLTLGRTFARYGERLATHDATLSVLAALRVRLFAGWARPQAARALALRPSRLLFRLTADIDALDSLYLRVLVPLGAALAAVLAATVALGLIHGGLGLVVLLLMAIGTASILRSTWASAVRPSRLRAHAIEAVRARSTDLVAGQTDLLMAGRLQAQCAAIARADARLASCDDQLNRLDAQATVAFGVLGSAVVSLTLLMAGWMVSVGVINVPVAVLAVLVAQAATDPLAALRRGALDIGRCLLAARRVAPQLSEMAAPSAVPGARVDTTPSMQLHEAAIYLHGVHVRHDGAAQDCLHSIDLHIKAGERVALIGCSGAGKSSLMALLTGELSPRLGTVQVGAHGWLTQCTELFQDSLRDNLQLACADVSDDLIWQALATAGLADTVHAWPQGLDTALGEGGLGLSGGQARRLALARLLLRSVPLWLLDEPTEGLDARTADDVLNKLHKLGAGRTWLLATHLRREAELADRILVLCAGRICAQWRRGDAGFEAALAGLRPD
ncbi:ABC transporter ATP-binding protein [Aquitalea magnusonii]|nr:ABC transporter ATP-binding protein [Aquitalea magnusonii]